MDTFNLMKDYLIKNHPIYRDVLFIDIIKYIEKNVIINFSNKKYITRFYINKNGIKYRYYILEHFKFHGFIAELIDNHIFISINFKLIYN